MRLVIVALIVLGFLVNFAFANGRAGIVLQERGNFKIGTPLTQAELE